MLWHKQSLIKWVALASVLTGGLVAASSSRSIRTDVSPFGGSEGWRVRSSGASRDTRPVAPLFSFASPTSYFGTTGPYAGLPATDGCKDPATVTGTKGEALTFTRASASSCCTDAVGAAAASCATLEQCTSGQVCVQSRGLRVNRGYTQFTQRTEEFDNAAWTKGGSPTVAVVTANYATAPDGTLTADRVQLDATTGGNYSFVYQSTCPTGAQTTGSLWVKSNDGSSGTIDFWHYGGSGISCTTCSYTGSWGARCVHTPSGSTGTATIVFGNDGANCGAGSRSAKDLSVWGLNCTATAYAMPYVKAEGASVAVAAEVASFPAVTAVANSGSTSLDYMPSWGGISGPTDALLTGGSTGRYLYLVGASGAGFRSYDGVNNPQTNTTFTANTVIRGGASWGGSTLTVRNITGSTSGSSSFDGTMATGALELGRSSWGAVGVDGIISDVCLDADPTRCYP